MKKIICGLLSVLLLNNCVYAEYPEYLHKTYVDQTIDFLERVDIVRNVRTRWNSEDYIKRRNAFEMTYIVYMGQRDFIVADSTEKEAFKYFIDIEPNTYDDYLTASLVLVELISGKDDDGNNIAALDDYVTYEEALTMIGYMFSSTLDYIAANVHNPIPKSEHPYFDFACNIGLINSDSMIDVESLQLDESVLDQYITAYDFLCLIRRALHIPVIKAIGYEPDPCFHYIDYFVREYGIFYHPSETDIVN